MTDKEQADGLWVLAAKAVRAFRYYRKYVTELSKEDLEWMDGWLKDVKDFHQRALAAPDPDMPHG